LWHYRERGELRRPWQQHYALLKNATDKISRRATSSRVVRNNSFEITEEMRRPTVPVSPESRKRKETPQSATEEKDEQVFSQQSKQVARRLDQQTT
jgi:hypothetical protein